MTCRDTEYYDTLGVSSNSTPEEITKAYRKLMRANHPDKHHDNKEAAEERTKKINEAYSVLNDPEKREMYNRYGKEGSPSPFGMGNPHSTRIVVRPQDVRVSVRPTLTECYLGKTVSVTFQRRKACSCTKQASKESKISCRNCKGAGQCAQKRLRQIGPLTMQEVVYESCPDCSGLGKMSAAQFSCTSCKGSGTQEEQITCDVALPRGVTREVITVNGKGHELFGKDPGHVLVVVEPQDHYGDIPAEFLTGPSVESLPRPCFARLNPMDLVCKARITLYEALCGTSLFFRHMDDRVLQVQTPQQVLQTDQRICIKGEGMVTDSQRGNLYIILDVQMPSNEQVRQWSAQDRERLAALLAPSYSLPTNLAADKNYIAKVVKEQQSSSEGYEHYEEAHGATPECRQM